MNKGFLKGLKPKFIKQMAILMSICYLMTPLQHQITTVLHELAHGFEMPDSILSHNSQSHNFIEIHDQHEHKNYIIEHEHPILNLVDLVLDASKESHNSDELPESKVELKKHITTSAVKLPLKFKKVQSKTYFFYLGQLQIGFPKKLDAPPKNNLT